jgi:hypothetical protein
MPYSKSSGSPGKSARENLLLVEVQEVVVVGRELI